MIRLKRSECVILPLVLTGEWYRMIESGGKREEYRAVTDRYIVRFNNFQRKCADRDVDIHGHGFMRELPDAVVGFSLGYKKPSMFFTIACSMARGRPAMILEPNLCDHWAFAAIRNHAEHPEWGEPNEPHFVIKLCERVELVE